jgi:CBS domain-containing protein
MLSVSDFLVVFVNAWKQYTQQAAVAGMSDADLPTIDLDLGSQSIRDWQATIRGLSSSIPCLLTVAPQSPLLSMARQLLASRVHRLAVAADPLSHTVAAVVTQHQLLGHLLCRCLRAAPPADAPGGAHDRATPDDALAATGLGRWARLLTVCADTPAAVAAHILLSNRISGVPVVEGNWADRADESGNGAATVSEGGRVRVLGTFSRADVLLMSLHGVAASIVDRISVGALLGSRLQPVAVCRGSDLLVDVCKRLYALDKHHLVCVDGDGALQGVVALTDVLAYALRWELSEMRDTSDHTVDGPDAGPAGAVLGDMER